MKLTATYEELVAVEFPTIKKEEFNNELCGLICRVNKDEHINEVFLTGFPSDRIGEMLYIMKNATDTGYITFEKDGILYTKSEDKLYVKL